MSCGYLPEECGRPIAHWRVCLCFPVTTYHIAYLCNRDYQRRNCSLCIMTIDTDCSASIAGKESYQRWFSSVLPDKFNESVSAHLPIKDCDGLEGYSSNLQNGCYFLRSPCECRQVRGRLASQMKIRFISEMVVRLVAISPQFFPQSRDYNVFIININTRLRLWN